MGCGKSKEKVAKDSTDVQVKPKQNGSVHTHVEPKDAASATAHAPPSTTSMEAPMGRAAIAQMDVASTELGSTAAPASTPGRGKQASAPELGEDGNPVVLPKGDWVKTEGTPYYYSAAENLYYHPPSCQFYDPTNEMWYDPEKDEWYHDDTDDDHEG